MWDHWHIGQKPSAGKTVLLPNRKAESVLPSTFLENLKMGGREIMPSVIHQSNSRAIIYSCKESKIKNLGAG